LSWRTRLELHGALAFDDAAALVIRRGRLAKIRRVRGEHLLLDLQEEWVLRPVALHVDAEVAQADGAGADDLERDIERGVLSEKVLALGLQALGVSGERVEDAARGLTVDAGEDGLNGLEDARAGEGALRQLQGRGPFSGTGRAADGHGEDFETVHRSGALGDAQDLRDGLDIMETVDLVTREVEHGHSREGVHHGAVALQGGLGGFAEQAVLRAHLAAREDEAGSHALDIPLERAADSFVEVIDVEDQAAIGRGEGAEVADVRVAAELCVDPGVGPKREVVGHNGNRAAEEAEGRHGHAFVLDGDERGYAAAHRGGDKSKRVLAAVPRLPAGEFGAAHVFTLRLAEGEALAETLWNRHRSSRGLVARISGEGPGESRVRASMKPASVSHPPISAKE